MMRSLRRYRLAWLGMGLFAGLVLGSLWPSIPLHGDATDRSENIIMATGFVDEGIEAVFFLDSLTGLLYGGVPSLQRMQDYQAMWTANPGVDMLTWIQTVNTAAIGKGAGAKGASPRPAIQPPQTPRFVMVTGWMDVRQGAARLKPSRCVVHVCEANTGIVMTYLLPWSPQMHNSNQPLRMSMQLWAAQKFDTAVIRPQE